MIDRETIYEYKQKDYPSRIIFRFSCLAGMRCLWRLTWQLQYTGELYRVLFLFRPKKYCGNVLNRLGGVMLEVKAVEPFHKRCSFLLD